MKMYASRSNFSMSKKDIFGGEKTIPIVPPPYKDYEKSFAYVPSWKVIKDLSCKYLMSLNAFETKVMQGTDGIMFKGDASHKVTKLVYVNVDEKVFHGLYTLMNEFGEVTGWWFIRTGKMDEIEASIKRIKKRYDMHNFDRPIIIYSDRPEMDRSIWERIWPSIQPNEDEGSGDISHTANIVQMQLPPSMESPNVVTRADECCAVINRIRENLNVNESENVIGFDLEWNKGNNPVATIQLTLRSGLTFIFCLKGILGKR